MAEVPERSWSTAMHSIARVGEQAAIVHAANTAARIRPMGITLAALSSDAGWGIFRMAFLRFEPEGRKCSAAAADKH